MSIFTVKDGRKILPRSFYVKILIFLGLIGLSVATMQPLQLFINREIQKIRDNLITEMETLTGMEIRYSSVKPSFFNSLEIRNLSFSKNHEPVLTVSKVKITFSIIELLLKKKSFVHTVMLDGPAISIDMQRDREILDTLASLFGTNDEKNEGDPAGQLRQYFPKDADFRIQHGFFSLVDGNSSFRAEDVNLHVREEEGGFSIDGRLLSQVKQVGVFERTIVLKTEMNINGLAGIDLQSVNARISFVSTSCHEQDAVSRNGSYFNVPVNNAKSPHVLFTVKPFDIDVSYANSAVNIDIRDESKTAFRFLFDTKTQNMSAALRLDDFSLTDKISFSGNFFIPGHLLDMRMNGESSLELIDNRARYDINIRGGNLSNSPLLPLTDAFLISFSGNNERVNVNNFIVSASENTARKGYFRGKAGFSGNMGITPFRPSGTLIFDRFSISGDKDMSATFKIQNRAGEIDILSDDISIADAQIESVEISITPAKRDVGVSVSLFTKESGNIFLDAVYNLNPGHIEASLTLDEISFFELTEIFRPFADMGSNSVISRTVLKNSFVATDIFFSTDFKNMIYNAPSIRFNLGETEGLLSLSGTDRQFILSEGVFSGKENEFLIAANVDFSNPMYLNFNVNANYMDLAWNVDGQVLDRSTLIVRDLNGLYIYGNIDKSGGLSGYIEGIDFPFPIDGKPVFLNFYSTVRYGSADFWNVDINRFIISDFAPESQNEFLRISGSADQDGASFREILYSDDVGILAGSADFAWDNDFSYLEFIVNITDGYEGGEFYNLEGSLKDERINVKAAVSNMHINRFVNSSNPVTISAEANVIWESINSFNAQINLSSLRTRVNHELMSASVAVVFNNDELFVRNLHLDYGGIKTVMPELEISRALGTAKARADLGGFTAYRNIEANMSLDVDFDIIDSWMDLEQVINNFNGTLLIGDVQYGNLRQDRFVFEFLSIDRAISVKGGINEMLRLEMDKTGNFFLGLSSPMPVRGTFIGTLKNGLLDSTCNNFFIDLSTLYSLTAPSRDFNITGGYVTGNLDIRGPLINPEFFGSGRGTSMRFDVPNYLGDEIRPVPFNITAEGYEMTFGPAIALCGTGGGMISGWFFFQNWSPINVGLDINIPRENPIPYDFNITGFLASGNASGNLKLTLDGINSQMELTGDLFTNDAELGMSMEDIASNNNDSEENIMDTYVELTITTGSKVEFIWPVTNPIIRANPEMGTVINVSSDTAAGQFSINSDIKVRSGELYYLDRSYFIRQGNLVFRENETHFNPKFSARAEIRERTDTGPVTISLIVENQPLLSFAPRFEASPSLTQLEIYSILGQNFSALEGDEDSTDQVRLLVNSTDFAVQVLASSDLFSQFVFLRQFERGIRDTFGLDMFSVRSKFIQNALIAGAGLDSQPTDGSQRFGNYLDNTTVFIGKYIGQHMFVSTMLTMKYDENSNFLGGLRIEPDIGIELQSPFVNIRWDFFPYSPERSWVFDNSITLSWSMSF